jgi:hypothetical protein
MKALILSLAMGYVILSFTQCKKNNSGSQPPAVDSTARLPEGRYILRTRYVQCGTDSISFALGLYSNYEYMAFNTIRSQDIPELKQNEDFIWHLQPVYQYTAYDPAKKPEDYGLLGYRIYKIFPDGISCYFIGMIRPVRNHEDIPDGTSSNQKLQRIPIDEIPRNLIGIGEPLIYPPGYGEDDHPGHFDEYSAIFGLHKTTNGGYRLWNNRYEHVFHNWKGAWVLTTTNNWADDVCDNAQFPVWRPLGSYTCNMVNEDNDNFRRCYIDEFYFEKVD